VKPQNTLRNQTCNLAYILDISLLTSLLSKYLY